MKNKKEAVIIAIGVVFLVFVLVYTMGVFEKLGEKVAQEFYVNAKGQKWTLPTEGAYDFTVSASGYPRFIGGSIVPLKVKVGDTQTMTVRIASPVPIKSVVATIETDTMTRDIPLVLKESKTLSAEYFENQPYLINEDDELIINKEGSNYAEDALKKLVASAEAQSLVEYVFEGTWVVEDTHTKTYHTAFYAIDDEENSDKLTLAWSDPVCDFFADGTLKESCTLNSGIDGFDGGNLTIPDGSTVTVNASGTFVWNGDADSNASLIIQNGGEIVIQDNSDAQVKEAVLWYGDADSDTWAGDLAYHIICPDPCINLIRVKNSPTRPWASPPINDGLDCQDLNADVFPGQTKYFFDSYEQSGGGDEMSHDYNCDGNTEGGWGDAGAGVSIEEELVYSTIWHAYGEGEEGEIYISEAFDPILDGCGVEPATGNQCNGDMVSTCQVGKTFRPMELDAVDNAWLFGEEQCPPQLTCISQTVHSYCR